MDVFTVSECSKQKTFLIAIVDGTGDAGAHGNESYWEDGVGNGIGVVGKGSGSNVYYWAVGVCVGTR
jgi:hypothetical protein